MICIKASYSYGIFKSGLSKSNWNRAFIGRRRKRFLELSSEFGIPIVEDDPYSLTSFNGEVNPTLKSMDQNGNVLYISSLSKIVASGLRIGWVIGPTRVIER